MVGTWNADITCRMDVQAGSEFRTGVEVLEKFRQQVYPSPCFRQFVEAHVREFICVDYPRKFVGHHRLFPIKNRFLHFGSMQAEDDEQKKHAHKRTACMRVSFPVNSGVPSAASHTTRFFFCF